MRNVTGERGPVCQLARESISMENSHQEGKLRIVKDGNVFQWSA